MATLPTRLRLLSEGDCNRFVNPRTNARSQIVNLDEQKRVVPNLLKKLGSKTSQAVIRLLTIYYIPAFYLNLWLLA